MSSPSAVGRTSRWMADQDDRAAHSIEVKVENRIKNTHLLAALALLYPNCGGDSSDDDGTATDTDTDTDTTTDTETDTDTNLDTDADTDTDTETDTGTGSDDVCARCAL